MRLTLCAALAGATCESSTFRLSTSGFGVGSSCMLQFDSSNEVISAADSPIVVVISDLKVRHGSELYR